MPWENRESGRYFYLAKKVAGKVVKTYVGQGAIADLLAAAEATERVERESRLRQERETRENLDRQSERVSDLLYRAHLAFQAAMLSAGLRRHRKGQWRCPRDSGTSNAARRT